jgi:hypothetical protein
MNPLEAIQVAVTRRDPAAGPGPAWQPEELADLATMLACYTIGGAYAAFEEGETGSIEPGKAADLAILDRNLFQIPKSEIAKTRVLSTLLAGREVYRDPSWDGAGSLSGAFPDGRNDRGRSRNVSGGAPPSRGEIRNAFGDSRNDFPRGLADFLRFLADFRRSFADFRGSSKEFPDSRK